MPAALTTRLERLEATRRAANQARHDAAIEELGRTMDPEHVKIVQDWMHVHGLDRRPVALPGESPYATFARLRPPALVRAAWLLVEAHVRTGCPVSLAPEVARVYVEDQDAYPVNPCDGCGYRLPMQGTLRPDGSLANVAYYVGTCPACGLDNHPDDDREEGDAP